MLAPVHVPTPATITVTDGIMTTYILGYILDPLYLRGVFVFAVVVAGWGSRYDLVIQWTDG